MSGAREFKVLSMSVVSQDPEGFEQALTELMRKHSIPGIEATLTVAGRPGVVKVVREMPKPGSVIQPAQFKVNMDVPIDDDRMRDLLITAFEGGSNYWVQTYTKVFPSGKSNKDYEFPQYGVPFETGGSLVVEYNDGKNRKAVLDRAAMQRGLDLMAGKYQRHLLDFSLGNEDADTADVWLQLALLGSVVFG